MFGISIAEAEIICEGKLYNYTGEISTEITGQIVIDSRKVNCGDIFAAFNGEKVDGHDFVDAAYMKGALFSLVERVPEGANCPLMIVDDVRLAIIRLASEFRKRINIPVIGVTGSVGKTTSKEMISAVLSAKYNVLKTSGNLNNSIGVPMTVSSIKREHEVAVIEMGISDFGEMRELASIAMPTIGVFTIIGHAHLEFLHSLDGVYKAKTEMIELLPANGIIVANGDDGQLRKLSDDRRTIFYGIESKSDVTAQNIFMNDNGFTHCSISSSDRKIEILIPAFGKHVVYAAMLAATVAIQLGMSNKEIADGIAQYVVPGRRGKIIRNSKYTIIDDCYNANPDSMKSAIDSAMALEGRHVFVLGDMLELGTESAKMHAEIGEYARNCGADEVLTSGNLGCFISKGAGNIGKYFNDIDALISYIENYSRYGDVIMVKASRGMHFEKIIDSIK